MNRKRFFLFGGVSAVALAAGAGLTWHRLAPSMGDLAAGSALFGQTFNDADGKAQPMAQWRGLLLVVNFWATWCAPCVEEMPDLNRVRNEYAGRGVEIIGLGIDHPNRIREFRDQFNLSLPLLAAGAAGSELTRALGNRGGVLPYTVLIARGGGVVDRKIGRIKRAELVDWLDPHLRS